MKETYDALMILGPTASGKTRLAVDLCSLIRAEVLNADSRMVYKHLNIGTGKDSVLYHTQGGIIPSHLTDLAEPTEPFHVFAWQKAFYDCLEELHTRKVIPLICGGTGMYLESVLKGFNNTAFEVNPALRREYELLSKSELENIWHQLPPHPFKGTASTDTSKRLLRSIEILHTLLHEPNIQTNFYPVKAYIIGLNPDPQIRQQQIRKRLEQRMQEGLTEEVEQLLQMGVSHERLEFLGLEYKFLSMYLRGLYTKTEMTELLYIAIRQFAKRQMTYFRKLERDGFTIHWFADTDQAFQFYHNKGLPEFKHAQI